MQCNVLSYYGGLVFNVHGVLALISCYISVLFVIVVIFCFDH